jgi:hypothetical protein
LQLLFLKQAKAKKEANIKKKNKKTVETKYPTGGKPVEMSKPNESQKVTVKGTGKARKQTATWY